MTVKALADTVLQHEASGYFAISRACKRKCSDDDPDADRWVPALRLKFRKYDETPCSVQYSWADPLEDSLTVLEEDELQSAKLLVVESGWAMHFLRANSSSVCLRGIRAPRTVPIEACSASIIRTAIDGLTKFETEGTAEDVCFDREASADNPSISFRGR